MNTKKFLTTSLTLCLLGMNISPAAYAFNLKFIPLKMPVRAKKHVQKPVPVLSSSVNEYKFDNVNIEWWKDYNDPILEGYISKAIKQNQDMQVATLKVEQARQNVKLQFSKELPSLFIGASPVLYKMPGDSSSSGAMSVPIIANYELDLFGKNHDKTKAIKKIYEEAKCQERAVYIAIASEIGGTYLNVVKLDKEIAIQNQIISSRKQIYNLMKLRNEQGITSTADLVKAHKSYVMAVSSMSDLKKGRSILLNSLAVLIGDSPENVGEIKRISYDKLAYKKPIPVSISSDIIVQRPDYLAAEKQVEKAGLDVKVARKELLPSFNILGLASFAATSMSNSMSWNNALSLITAGINWNAYTGGAKVANLKLQKNLYEQVLQEYYKTNLTAIQEVNDSLTSLKLDNEKYKKDVETYNMQKADFGYTQARYNQGVISYLDMIQQKESLYSMEAMVVSSKTDCYIDRISLYKAIGGKNS